MNVEPYKMMFVVFHIVDYDASVAMNIFVASTFASFSATAAETVDEPTIIIEIKEFN